MKYRTLLLLLFNVPLVLMRSEAPVAEKIWSERCVKNQVVLNDCNWCQCGANGRYICKAQRCSQVDMFGHFNDAIKELDQGMNGRGSWRSGGGACEPGMFYQKDDDLCYCNELGQWPNAVCRDIFRIIHSVETTDHKEPIENNSCIATKLYLFQCNVCSCPASGKIDPKLCTKKKCDDEDEILERTHSKDTAQAVYATCTPNKTYKIGCRTCLCLRNNRLLCDNCTDKDDHNRFTEPKTECHLKKPGKVFKKDCNFCHCDDNGTIYCTAKHCLEHHTEISIPDGKYTRVDKVEDEQYCEPNTKLKRDCNTCHCFLENGVKYFGCTLKTCKLTIHSSDTSCVEGTSYLLNCMICHCVVNEGIKREYCTVDDTCVKKTNGLRSKLSSMHGYCEPMHVYQQDCNRCRCLADGKTVACTSKICPKRKGKNKNSLLTSFKAELEANIEKEPLIEDNSLVMEFIPFVQRGYVCPKGQTYMVGCNICYCMNTGNAVCTTKKC